MGHADIGPCIRLDKHRASIARRDVPADLNMPVEMFGMRLEGKLPERLPLRHMSAGNRTVIDGMPVEFAGRGGVFCPPEFAR